MMLGYETLTEHIKDPLVEYDDARTHHDPDPSSLLECKVAGTESLDIQDKKDRVDRGLQGRWFLLQWCISAGEKRTGLSDKTILFVMIVFTIAMLCDSHNDDGGGGE